MLNDIFAININISLNGDMEHKSDFHKYDCIISMNKTQRTKLRFWQEMSFMKSCVEQKSKTCLGS